LAEDRVVIVRAATSPTELDQARIFFRAFVAWHRKRHAEDLGLIDRYFDSGGFERELASLPTGWYSSGWPCRPDPAGGLEDSAQRELASGYARGRSAGTGHGDLDGGPRG